MPGTPGFAGRIRAAFSRPLMGALVAVAALASLGVATALAAPPPDGRTYELVTPGHTGRNALLQPSISADGTRISYGALSSHDGAHSNVLNTYVATRNADGTWTNRPLQRARRDPSGPIGWSPVDAAGSDYSAFIAQGLQGLTGGGTFPYDRFDANGNSVETLISGFQNAQYATSTPDLAHSYFYLFDPVAGQPDSAAGRTSTRPTTARSRTSACCPTARCTSAVRASRRISSTTTASTTCLRTAVASSSCRPTRKRSTARIRRRTPRACTRAPAAHGADQRGARRRDRVRGPLRPGHR